MLRPDPGRRRRSSTVSRASNVELGSRRRSERSAAGVPSTGIKITGTGNHEHSDIPEDMQRDTNHGQEAPVNAPTVAASMKDDNAKDPMEGIINSMSALKFIPPSVRFGRGKGKARLARS